MSPERAEKKKPRQTSDGSYRALRAVLDVVDGQFHLRLVVDVGLLEEGDAAEEDGVVGSLRTEAINRGLLLLL